MRPVASAEIFQGESPDDGGASTGRGAPARALDGPHARVSRPPPRDSRRVRARARAHASPRRRGGACVRGGGRGVSRRAPRARRRLGDGRAAACGARGGAVPRRRGPDQANAFVAAVEALYEAGVRPVPLDIRLSDLGPDPEELEARATPRTRGILVVHLYG